MEKLGSPLPALGPLHHGHTGEATLTEPGGRWEGGGHNIIPGTWGSARPEVFPEGNVSLHPRVGHATGRQGWEPQGLCSRGPEALLRFRVLGPCGHRRDCGSPRRPPDLTELSCPGLQSQCSWCRVPLPPTTPPPFTQNPVMPQWDPVCAPTIALLPTSIVLKAQQAGQGRLELCHQLLCDLRPVPDPSGPVSPLEPEDSDR